MYKRGKGYEKHEFLRAFRKSEVADWQGAVEVWTQLAKSSNWRNAGRACLNLAVANEVLGKNADALLWARKAWEAVNFEWRLKLAISLEFIALYLFWRDWREPKSRPGYCQKCGYSLTGNTSGVCPECGTAIGHKE